MPLSLRAYSDSALSSVISKLNFLQRSDGATGAVDAVIHLGSTVSGKKFESASDPGVDPIVFSVADSDLGAGQSSAAVKLATTAAGLDAAVAGEPLSIGPQILSGGSNSVEIYVRLEADNLAEGTYNDLSLQTNDLVESYA